MMISVNPLVRGFKQLFLSLNQIISFIVEIFQLILPFLHILARIPAFKQLPLQHGAIVAYRGDTLA